MSEPAEHIYVEYGLDFDNNRLGFGRSVEIEHPDGSEERLKSSIRLKNVSYYFRFWIFKRVLILSRNGLEVKSKGRNNLKIVWGLAGERASK